MRRSHWALSIGLLWMVSVVPAAVCAERPEDASEAPATGTGGDSSLARVYVSPERGLVVESGEALFELHGYAWFRAESDTRVAGETDLAGSIPVGRVFSVGSAFESKFRYFAQTEFAGRRVEFLDLFAEWTFHPAFRLRVGQFRTPYSRAYITPLTNLQLSTRGLVLDHFKLNRDTGAMASGSLASGFFHYDLAVVNGATINTRDGDRDAPAVILRTEFRFGDPVPYDQVPSLVLKDPRGLTLGLGGAFAQRAIRGTAGTSREENWNASIDLAWMHGPISVRTETFLRASRNSPRTATALGAYAQLGVFVVPRQIEVGGRAGWLSDGPDIQSYEAFLTAYWKTAERALGHHLKTIVSYRFDSRTPDGIDARDLHTVLIQAQIFF